MTRRLMVHAAVVLVAGCLDARTRRRATGQETGSAAAPPAFPPILNHTLGELNDNNFEEYGEWLYHITVMGTPSATEPWGWQFDGHHAIINYFVLGDQVVMTPYFAGSEPVIARSGKFKGTEILAAEQSQALAFVNGLDAGQRAKAILRSPKTNNNILTEAWRDNVVLDYAGLRRRSCPPRSGSNCSISRSSISGTWTLDMRG